MNILVTGGGGSIGGAVTKALLSGGENVTAMDWNEESLCLLRDECGARVLPGDVREHADFRLAAKFVDEGRYDAVVHCGALKHVDLCECNPALAWDVNSAPAPSDMALMWGARFVYLSTDKAVNPVGTLGCSKAAGEEEARKVENHAVVRFGNVVGSRGSLAPRVYGMARRHMASGSAKPLVLPITDRAMTRYFLTLKEAAEAVCGAVYGDTARAGFFGRSARVEDFLAACRDLYCPNAVIEEVGARPGEKLHEEDGRGGSSREGPHMSVEDLTAMLEECGDE